MSDENLDVRLEQDTYLRYLEETDPLRERTNLEIIATLDLPAGSRGLDLGCGVGTQALMLAEAIGPRGRVIGLDNNAGFLKRARAVAGARGLSERVTFQEANCQQRLPFEDGAFDWVWSSDYLGYRPLSTEVTRVIKPGGSLNILFWSSEQLLPGYPLLESKLRSTRAGLSPFCAGSRPEEHPLRALARLRKAGLVDCTAKTFVTTACAPLEPTIRRAMTDILEMRWPGVESELSGEDAGLYRRLTDPSSPDFILDLPDYYGFFTYALFRGWRVAEGSE